MTAKGSQQQVSAPLAKSAPMPILYKEPVALDADTHRDLAVGFSPTGYRFAASAHCVMLTVVEFAEACREYPIIFYAADDGSITPLALLGFQAGENLYVDDAGAWKASYIPTYIRRYPFIPADTGTDEFPICIDQKFDGINIEGGQRVFDAQGQPTVYCRQIQTFLNEYQTQPAITSTFTVKLHRLGLFKPMDADIKLDTNQQLQVQGLFMVDEDSLLSLGESKIVELQREGYLSLIHSHLISLKNMARLIEMKAQRRQG